MTGPADWNAELYLRFEDERTRPALDLLQRVRLTDPRRSIDLGCGPGNSTELIAARFPAATIEGLDTSPDMIEAARKRLPNVAFSLGDVAGYYSMVNECIEALRARDIVNLMGNHDFYLVDDVPCPRSNSANAAIEWQRKAVTAENLAWLAESPRNGLRLGPLSLVHAGWNDPIDEYIEVVTPDYFANRDGEVFVSGHVHVQGCWPVGAKTYCNPGSVGQPRDGDPRAAFALWDGEQMHLRRVEYDIDEIAKHMREAGFSEYFYENLRAGSRIGGKFSRIKLS